MENHSLFLIVRKMVQSWEPRSANNFGQDVRFAVTWYAVISSVRCRTNSDKIFLFVSRIKGKWELELDSTGIYEPDPKNLPPQSLAICPCLMWPRYLQDVVQKYERYANQAVQDRITRPYSLVWLAGEKRCHWPRQYNF